MTVFANGLEVACKKQGNRILAAFPDVCFTPPENPATPPGVPVPYPSFGLDSDTDKGTGTVKIGGETVSHKNLSYYSKTSGTDAGCAAKKGIVSSKNTGKAYDKAWSGNVKGEAKPVSRFTDLATTNTNGATNGAFSVLVSSIGISNGIAGPVKWTQCPCCKVVPAHDNQVDAWGNMYPPVKEADYYDDRMRQADAKLADIERRVAEGDPTLSAAAADGARAQHAKRQGYRKTIADARAKKPPCPNLHDPPDEGCGTHLQTERSYRDILNDQNPNRVRRFEADAAAKYPADPGKARDAARVAINNDVRKRILGFTDGVKNDVRKRDGKGNVNHMTPIEAGGCPTSMNNLISDGALPPDCKELNTAQDRLQQTHYE